MIFRKFLISILLLSFLVPPVFLPATARAQGAGGTVIGRAFTRTARIAAAQLEVDQATEAFFVAFGAATVVKAAIPAGANCLVFAAFCTAVLTAQAAQAEAEFQKSWNRLQIALDNFAEANKDIVDDILDMLEKVLFQTLKKRVLDMMVDQIIGYIQGEGEPRFVTDWKGFMDDVAQGAAGEFAKELGLGFLCSPFSLQLRLSLLPVQRFPVNRFDCTLDKIVGNIQNFYDDFRNGGWVAFDSALQMNNNFYGAFFLAMDARSNAIAEAIHVSGQELEVGGGFLSAKRCVDERGIEVPTDQVEAYRAAVQQDRTGTRKLTCDIVTPGRTLGAAVEKAVGSDIDFIVNAEDLSAYIAAIADALINRVIKEGFGLLGVSTPNGPQVGKGYGHEVITGPESFPPSLRDANSRFGASRRDSLDYVPPAPSAQQVAAARDARTSARQTLIQHINLQSSLVDKLKELETCQGGTSAAAQATHASLQTEKATLNKLQSDADSNDAAIQQLDAPSRAISNNITAALSFKTNTEQRFLNAQVSIPLQLELTRSKLLDCKAGK